MKKFKLAAITLLISGFAFYSCGGGGTAWVQDGSSFAGGEEYVTSLGIASDGSTPYVAYTALNAGHLNVYEKHFNGADWVQDGGSLNVDTTRDSMNVSIGCLGAVPYVTWLERDSSGGASDTTRIFTKRWR